MELHAAWLYSYWRIPDSIATSIQWIWFPGIDEFTSVVPSYAAVNLIGLIPWWHEAGAAHSGPGRRERARTEGRIPSRYRIRPQPDQSAGRRSSAGVVGPFGNNRAGLGQHPALAQGIFPPSQWE